MQCFCDLIIQTLLSFRSGSTLRHPIRNNVAQPFRQADQMSISQVKDSSIKGAKGSPLRVPNMMRVYGRFRDDEPSLSWQSIMLQGHEVRVTVQFVVPTLKCIANRKSTLEVENNRCYQSSSNQLCGLSFVLLCHIKQSFGSSFRLDRKD